MRRRSKDPFGQVAVNLGFCTPNDVKEALAAQRQLASDEQPHNLVGMILLERGVISTTQLIHVLRFCDRTAHPAEGKPESRSTSVPRKKRATSPRTRKKAGRGKA